WVSRRDAQHGRPRPRGRATAEPVPARALRCARHSCQRPRRWQGTRARPIFSAPSGARTPCRPIRRRFQDRRRGRFRSTMALKAVLFDLGDVIMREETEQKVDGVTQRAELVPGMADLLRDLKGEGKRLGLVADTREGTYLNVLRQHALYDLFDAFAISDLLGAEKPDRRMFAHALA